MTALSVFDRKAGKMIEEKIFGESGVRFLYESRIGSELEQLLSRPWFSKVYGIFQNLPSSSRAIRPFIEKFKIPMEEFEPGLFRNFNDFFIRRLKQGTRPFETDARRFSAPAEGRYLVFPRVDETTPLPIKGATLNGSALLGGDRSKNHRPLGLQGLDLDRFRGGPGFIARLCPVDYHRFHYPDSGKIMGRGRLQGPLHSVNPIALKKKGDLLFRNEREVTILETQNFGTLAYVEVGAICVGKIVQSDPKKDGFMRGEEKGYFLFGGSTVIVLGEPGAFTFDTDLVNRSSEGIESLIRLGEGIATKCQQKL